MTDDTIIIEPTTFQRHVLGIPETLNLFLGGGRGGGKSHGVLFLVLRHIAKYGRKARVLVIRETHKAVEEAQEEMSLLMTQSFPTGVAHNRNKGTITAPNGGRVEFNQLSKPGDYEKYQGRSFTMLVYEEFGLAKNRRWIDLLKSNLRATKDVPLQEVRTANPGGTQHAYIHKTFVAAGPPWQPFEVDGETWVYCPSTLVDNDYLDHDNYRRKLLAACGRDEELARAWISGDWNIARGAYFATVLSEDAHMLPVDWAASRPKGFARHWRPALALDWGSSAPAVALIGVKSPGIQGFPKDSIIILDELAVCDPNDLTVGLEWPPAKLADAIKELCQFWHIPAQGVADDARGLEESLISVLRQHGVFVNKPKKQRVAGLQLIRNMLAAAAAPPGSPGAGQPGLWISTRCRYLWETMPFVERDPSRPEDIMTTGPDHGVDCLRYLCQHMTTVARPGKVRGWF